MSTEVHIPSEWAAIDVAHLQGTVMVIGGVDTGKSTFARYLFLRLCQAGRRVAYLDSDMGQSTLGLPTTLNMALHDPADPPDFPPHRHRTAYFVGSTSPRGFMLPTVVGVYRLQQRAVQLGAQVIVVDTTGLINPASGGGALKQWKIELLQPTVLFALQRTTELEHILRPWRHDPRVTVHMVPVSRQAQDKSREERISRRTGRFWTYFQNARRIHVSLRRYAVFNMTGSVAGRLLAFQDAEGFALGLGVAHEIEATSGALVVTTPLETLRDVHSLRFGALRIDPHTGRELGRVGPAARPSPRAGSERGTSQGRPPASDR